MANIPDRRTLLEDLETRQEEALRLLADLEIKIHATLTSFTAAEATAPVKLYEPAA